MKTSLLAVSVVLVACGGGNKIESREAAADAVYSSAQPLTSPGGPGGMMMTGTAPGQPVTVPCRLSGSATFSDFKLTGDIVPGKISGKLSAAMRLDACSNVTVDDPATAQHEENPVIATGKADVALVLDVDGSSGGSVLVSQSLVGRIAYSGGINDVADYDVALVVDVNATAANTINVGLKGTIKTTQQLYTYTGDQISVSPGHIRVDL